MFVTLKKITHLNFQAIWKENTVNAKLEKL